MLISKGNPQRFPELKGKIETIRYPVYVEPKIDGITNWLYLPSLCDPAIDDIEGPYLINGNGKILSELPITREMEMTHSPHRFLGELHCGDGKAGDFYKIKGASENELKFMVYDIDMPVTYEERSKWLDGHINDSEHIKLMRQHRCTTRSQVDYYFEEFVKQGYEGIVVKSFDSRLIMGPCPWVKMKHKETLDLKVFNISKTQERIEVLVPRINETGSFICGVKVSNKVKATLKVGDIVEIEHMGRIDGGNLRSPVFKRLREDKCATILMQK
jgi:hypothetical protein